EEAFHSMIHPDDLERTKAGIAEAVRNKSDYALEFRFLPRAGGVRWMVGRGTALCDQQGEAVRLAGIGMDVTDEKNSNLRILELNRGLERLVGENRTLLDV